MKLIRSGASCGPDICGKYVFILNGQGFSVHPSIHPSVHPSLRPSARLRQGTPSPSSTAAMRRARPIRSRTPSSDGRHAKVRSGTALRRRRFTTNQSRDRHPEGKAAPPAKDSSRERHPAEPHDHAAPSDGSDGTPMPATARSTDFHPGHSDNPVKTTHFVLRPVKTLKHGIRSTGL